MTLSNFDWTDKTSVRWFILLPTGHEGPYSLTALMKHKSSHDLNVWAEGLSSPIPLKVAIQRSEVPVEVAPAEEEIPPLPPLPEEGPEAPTPELETIPAPVEENKRYKRVFISFIVLAFGLWAGKEWMGAQSTFKINRPSGMAPTLFEKISTDFSFEGWEKRIFFKEYVSADMTHLWLVTSGFQHCEVEASFQSLPGKLLTTEDRSISFKTRSALKGHMAEFTSFDFSEGQKIIPGLYEMDLKAQNCDWDGLTARIGNFFRSPEKTYVTRMKVVLYHKGSAEFNTVLEKLIRKKLEFELKNQNQEELFWQDLQQKLQTLLAITLQIEQLFLDFSATAPSGFSPNLKNMVDKYTRNYGRFLTEFVIANEKYFADLEKDGQVDMNKKRGYESIVKVTAKTIGFESMLLIEELQQIKKPNQKLMKEIAQKVKKRFEILKGALNKKIIQLTEDRAT
jgi:hypothetical protein